jgi:hypothetical protein
VPVVLVVVVIAAALGAGRTRRTVDRVPAGVGGGQATVSFGSGVQQIPGPAGLDYTNGWVASSGAADIGVYAGSAPNDRANGLLVVARTSGGKQVIRNFLLRGSGAVTLLKPSRPAAESAAWRETIRFVTANGAVGTLDLATSTLALSR